MFELLIASASSHQEELKHLAVSQFRRGQNYSRGNLGGVLELDSCGEKVGTDVSPFLLIEFQIIQ